MRAIQIEEFGGPEAMELVELPDPGPAAGEVVVDVARAGSRGDAVTVHVVYDEPFRVPFVAWLLGPGVTLTADAAARQEFG